MVVMIVFTTMAVGLNMVVGYAGLLDLGYVAFYAVGAYTAGWFASEQFSQTSIDFGAVGIPKDLPGIHISMWLVLRCRTAHAPRRYRDRPADATASRRLPRHRDARVWRDRAAVRAQRRQPRRLRPHPRHVRDHPIDSLGFGAVGAAIGLPESFRQSFERSQWYFWVAVVILLITVFCSVRLRDSRLGRAWIAIREDETAAAAMGIPLMRTKTWAYALGAFFGGVAGALYASFKGRRVPGRLLFQHLGVPAVHGDPRWHGQRLGRASRRHDPRLAQRRGPRDDRLEGPATGAQLRPAPSTSSGSTGSSSS